MISWQVIEPAPPPLVTRRRRRGLGVLAGGTITSSRA
jgi:hypothetical protein